MWRLAPRVDVTFVSFACFVAGDIWNRLFNGHSENDQEGIFTATFWPINNKAADPLRATRAARRFAFPLRAQYDYS
jgi:hypothetical protein